MNISGTQIGLIRSYYSHLILSVYSLVLLQYGPAFIVMHYCLYIGLYCNDNNRAFANVQI